MASSECRAPRALAIVAAALALAFAGAAPAQAQMGVSGFGGGAPIGASKHPATGTAAPPPPSALPGAEATTKAAPQTQSPSSMDPTAALFDAINRGDLAAARSAIDRGADLDGKNVLGMTPIELSIDLGRNPITFLLLSMRGGEPTGPSRAATLGAGSAGGRKPGVSGTSARAAKPPVRRPTAHPVARQAAPRPVRPTARVAQEQPPAVGATQGAGGGTPVPAAGFLGFSPSR
jgi:hypothetical protein